MIRLIVTRCGYVESNQMARVCWTYRRMRLEDSQSLRPEESLRLLVSELAKEFRREVLFDYDSHRGHTSQLERYEKYACADCSVCQRPTHKPFEPELFMEWLVSLSSAVASAGIGDQSIDELDHWWPWDSFSELRLIKPNEILLVEENFDRVAVACITPDDTFTEDEREMWLDFQTEIHAFNISKDENKCWQVETDYARYVTDLNENGD